MLGGRSAGLGFDRLNGKLAEQTWSMASDILSEKRTPPPPPPADDRPDGRAEERAAEERWGPQLLRSSPDPDPDVLRRGGAAEQPLSREALILSLIPLTRLCLGETLTTVLAAAATVAPAIGIDDTASSNDSPPNQSCLIDI